MENQFLSQENFDPLVLQKKLEESELLLNSMVRQSPSGICILNAKTLIPEVVNDTFIEIAGKPKELFEKESYWTIFAEVAEDFEPILKNVIETGVAYHTEDTPMTLIRHGLPQLIYVSFVYEPIKDTNGSVARIIVYVVDVTSKVLSRKKVEQSEQNLRNTILQAPVAMAILRGEDYVVEIANVRMYELWGKPAEELFEKPIFQGLPEAKNQGFENLLSSVYNTGKSFSATGISINLPRPEGLETIYINLLYEPYREASGKITGIVVVATDVTEQIKSRQIIEASEAKYRTLFDTMDQGFAIVELIFNSDKEANDYRFIELNRRFEEQTGLKNAVGKTALELVPNLEKRWFEIYGKVALSGEPIRFTEGSEAMGRWFDVYAFRLGEYDSRRVAILFTDITERYNSTKENLQYLKEIEEAKDQLHFAIESAQLGTWDFNPSTNRFSGNNRLKEWFGLGPEEEIDLSIALNSILDIDRQRVVDAIQEALKYSSGGLYNINYTVVNPATKVERIVSVKGRAWFNDDKIAYRFHGTMEDITSRTVAQKEIDRVKERSLRKFEKIANTLPQIVWTATADGNLDYFNDQWFSYSGMTFEQSVGQGWALAIHSDDLPYLAETWNNSLNTGIPYEVEARIKSIDNSYNWALIRALPVYENENIAQWCGTCTLIQEQKESEQKLQRLSNELAAANEEIQASNEEISATNDDLVRLNNQLIKVNSDMDNFIYTASHDLKAPISNIEGLVLALKRYISKESLENPMVVKLMPMIQSSIERFKKTLLDLTEITKLQRIDQEEEKFVDINELIEDIKLDLAQLLVESKGKIVVNLNGNEILKYSSKNLRSIFYNLISNSLKYRSPKITPIISVIGEENSNYYIYSIRDNGLGMDLSNKVSIFGMFKRLHNHVEGSGIGLFIVKKIIENSGGKIEVESKVGEGSVFKIYFKKN